MCIHWDKKLETGNVLIDAQHRILVMLFRKLDIAVKTQLPDKTIMRILMEVRKFVEFHFYSEETLMHEVNYPDVGNHETIHSQLLFELNSLVAKINRRQEFPDDLLGFLNDWLVNHIGKEDQRVAIHVKLSEERPVAESIYLEYLLTSAPT